MGRLSDAERLKAAGMLNTTPAALPGGGLARKASSKMVAVLAQQKWLMDEMMLIDDDDDSVRVDAPEKGPMFPPCPSARPCAVPTSRPGSRRALE